MSKAEDVVNRLKLALDESKLLPYVQDELYPGLISRMTKFLRKAGGISDEEETEKLTTKIDSKNAEIKELKLLVEKLTVKPPTKEQEVVPVERSKGRHWWKFW